MFRFFSFRNSGAGAQLMSSAVTGGAGEAGISSSQLSRPRSDLLNTIARLQDEKTELQRSLDDANFQISLMRDARWPGQS